MAHYLVRVDGKEFDISLEYRSEKYVAQVNGREVNIRRTDSAKAGPSCLLMMNPTRSMFAPTVMTTAARFLCAAWRFLPR